LLLRSIEAKPPLLSFVPHLVLCYRD